MLNWFKKKEQPAGTPLRVDIHSHLLPGIDDGVKTIEESVALIQKLGDLGYRKLVTTPHVISDMYRNTPEIIGGLHAELTERLKAENVDVTVVAAAEYYLDQTLMEAIERDQPLLTFGDRYLLFETNFLTEPMMLKEFIFRASVKKYKLILAHPERYLYMSNDLVKLEDLINRGVRFQINISSISGHYSKAAQSTAFKLIDRGWVHWLGSDCHNLQHLHVMQDAMKHKYFQKALTLPLLNNTLE